MSCHWPFGWWMGFGGVFWIVIIAIVVSVVRPRRWYWHHWPYGPGYPQETALDILKKRYAKGEISKEDFDRMKRDLES
jgi:putative membrane protein